MNQFVHLHVHTEYSLLDGLSKIDKLVDRAVELGQTALAITDHGAMYGVVEFYEACHKRGVKPIIGVEAYLAKHGHTNKSAAQREYNHLILLCKDEVGYRNLIKLTTIAYTDGFYYKPRIDRALLEQYHEGLVCLSACASGELADALLEDDWEAAREVVAWYQRVFGDDYYIELQEHQIAKHRGLPEKLIAIAAEFGIPTVATGDCHYVMHEDHDAHELLLCIQSGSTMDDPTRWNLESDDFYLKSGDEMAAVWAGLAPESMSNSLAVAAKCNLTLDFGRVLLPEIGTIPNGMTPDAFLRNLCELGLEARYGERLTAVHRERLAMELDVIETTGFANYFLVVWDFVAYARQQDVLFGVRGSAAGSIVLYCLNITDIDPLEYELVFERFLNIERKEMPDIDMDFADDRRDEMIRYVTQKYGADHVAQIITFGTLGAKAALRDVGRALGVPLPEVNRVAALVPAMPGMSFERALKENAEFKQAYANDVAVKRLVDQARPLEGIARHASTHAAGVVISRDPLTDHVPLQRTARSGEDTADGGRMVQFDMNMVAKVGLLKMDFLGLINLTILDTARRLIRQRHGVEIDLPALPLDDPRTYELLASGQTVGVFQLEGTGMRRYIRDLKPTRFTDIAAMVALYRPGPMQHIPRFIDSKHGKVPITYPHDDLRNLLEETYGVIVYQDQVLFIARQFAGFSLGQADIFRKAMGKKDAQVMAEQRERFIEGAVGKGYDLETATTIFELIEPFAGYAFNKAHSVCYAMLAYQTAYLKANYSAEYMASLLTMYASVEDKVQLAVADCQRLGIAVLPPDINASHVAFAIEDSTSGPAIRCGFIVIKNVGAAAMAQVVDERDRHGPFVSVEDLASRIDLKAVNRRAWESLVKVGALDQFGQREVLLANVDRIIAVGQQAQRQRDSGQTSMFDLMGSAAPSPLPSLDLAAGGLSTASADQRLRWEKELLGVYLSDHPFKRYAALAEADTTANCGGIGPDLAGQVVVVAGMVASLRPMVSRSNGKPWLVVTLEDMDGSVELTVWNRSYEQTRDLWSEGTVVLVRARVEERNDRVNLICDDARRYVPSVPLVGEAYAGEVLERQAAMVAEPPEMDLFDEADDDRGAGGEGGGAVGSPVAAAEQALGRVLGPRLVINLRPTSDSTHDLDLLAEVFATLKAFRGEHSVRLVIERDQRVRTFDVPDVDFHDDLTARLVALLGAQALHDPVEPSLTEAPRAAAGSLPEVQRAG